MAYKVKETFYSLQGEGARAGRAAVFCRFSGCNLWSGREQDRLRALCSFCDTDFIGTHGDGGGHFKNAFDLVRHLKALWPQSSKGHPYLIYTGGEPGLQVDSLLIRESHHAGFEVAIETNGTIDLPPGIDWITVSPKSGTTLMIKEGHELKLVYPQKNLSPESVEGMKFQYYFLQPLDDENRKKHTERALLYCLQHPLWRLSLQHQKTLGIK